MIFNTRIRDYEKLDAASKDGLKFSNKSLSRILEDLDTIMLSVYKGGYYFDEIAGIYKTMYKAVMNETMSSKFLIIANNIFNEFEKTL